MPARAWHRAGDTLFDARTQLRTAWRGVAAGAADEQLGLIIAATERGALRLDAGRRAVLGCADVLAETRAEIDALRDRWPRPVTPPLLDPVAAAAATRARADLQLGWSEQAQTAEAATEACRLRLTASIAANRGSNGGTGLGFALGMDALTVDDDYRAADVTAQWAALSGAAQRLVLAGAGPFPPTTDTSPAGVAAAWAGLTALEQEAWIQLAPAVVGALDGMPTTTRDRANRIVLAGGIEDREQMLGLAAAAGDTALIAEIERQLGGMVALQQTLGAQDVGGVPTPVYLMAFDPTLVDRVAVAVGNPDTATNVGVFVPGTGSDLDSVPGNVGRAAALQQATRGAGTPAAATVMWLGYDAPGGVVAAAGDAAATAGADAFADFLSGLRAAHRDGEPASVTALLHSYAVLLGAQAAAQRPLDLDQLVFVGATGTEVASAADLKIAGVAAEAVGSRVVAMTMSTDPILYTGGTHPGMSQLPDFGVQTITLPGPATGAGDFAGSVLTGGLLAAVPGLGAVVGDGGSLPQIWDADAHSAYFTDPTALAVLGGLISRSFP